MEEMIRCAIEVRVPRSFAEKACEKHGTDNLNTAAECELVAIVQAHFAAKPAAAAPKPRGKRGSK